MYRLILSVNNSNKLISINKISNKLKEKYDNYEIDINFSTNSIVIDIYEKVYEYIIEYLIDYGNLTIIKYDKK